MELTVDLLEKWNKELDEAAEKHDDKTLLSIIKMLHDAVAEFHIH